MTLALNTTNVDNVKEGGGTDQNFDGTMEDMELSCDSLISYAGLYAGNISPMVFDSIHDNKKMEDSSSSTQQLYFSKGNSYY